MLVRQRHGLSVIAGGFVNHKRFLVPKKQMFGAPAQNMSGSSFYRIGSRRIAIHKVRQAPLARFERTLAQGATKQFVPQPQLVSADYVGLAVVGDLLDLALAVITLHLAAVEPFRLSRQAHDSADLVKTCL